MMLLSSYMVLNVSGGDRVSYTYDEIDDNTGDPVSQNNKRSFFAVDPELRQHIEAIREYIRANKLDVG